MIDYEKKVLLNPKVFKLDVVGPDGVTYTLHVNKSWTIDQVQP